MLQDQVLIGTISLLIVLLIVLLAGIWWWVPRWSANRLRLKVRDAKARTDIEDNFRKTLSQLFGGVAVLLGAAFAYYQSQTTAQQARDLLISQQTSKGFEQLGNGEIIIRLGGIYALEGVMNASLVYHVPIVEGLAAFVRERTPLRREPANPKPDEERLPPTDVQAALVVLGRRVLRKSETSRIDLARTHLRRANLSGANLSFVNLSYADLSGANLRGANLTEADLSGANLSGANLIEANLYEARLTEADLSYADLSFVNLSGANLRRANFTDANLSYARLTEANITEASLSRARFTGADLSRANLRGADLTDAALSGATLSEIVCDAQTRLPRGVQLPCASGASTTPR